MRTLAISILLISSLTSISQVWKLDSVKYNGKYYWLYPQYKNVNVYEAIDDWLCEPHTYCAGLPADGKWIEFFKEDSLQPACIWNYMDKNKEGEWTEFYLNGRIKEHGYYSKGQKDKHWISYFENGSVECDEFYKNGNLTGHWKCWDKDGWLYKEATQGSIQTEYYSNGKKKEEFLFFLNGERISEWYANGQLKFSQPYIGGDLKDTVQTNYYDNGQIESQGTTKNGALYGKWHVFDSTGNLLAEGAYSEFKSMSTDYSPGVKYLSFKTGKWVYYYENGKTMATGSYKNIPKVTQPGDLAKDKVESIKNNDWKYFDESGKPLPAEKANELLQE